MIDRRTFAAGSLVLLGAVAPGVGLAQTGGGMRRVGLLIPYRRDDAVVVERVAALRAELGRQGWHANQSVEIIEHWTSDDLEQVRIAADDLVSRNHVVQRELRHRRVDPRRADHGPRDLLPSAGNPAIVKGRRAVTLVR